MSLALTLVISNGMFCFLDSISPTNRRGDSQACSRQYRRIEEVHDVTSMQDVEMRDGDKQPPREPKTAGPLPANQLHVEDDDIHSYVRVQIRGITFRIGQTPSNNRIRTQNIVVSHQELEDMDILIQLLAESFRLSEEDCRAAISHRRQTSSTSNSNLLREYDADTDKKRHLNPGDVTDTANAVDQDRFTGGTKYWKCHNCGECWIQEDYSKGFYNNDFKECFNCHHLRCPKCISFSM